MEERWHAMVAGAPYADAQCLVAYDDRGAAAEIFFTETPSEPLPSEVDSTGALPTGFCASLVN
jgi:hypothetical protein